MFNRYVHATPSRPATDGTPVTLRDGSTVLIRQVRGTDAPLLADGFARLSARSRQLRFLGPKKMLSAAELRYLTHVDHHDHEAIGALSLAEGRGVGVARYIRDADDPGGAEIAVTWNIFNGGTDSARERQYANLLTQAENLRDKACVDARQTVSVAFNDVRKLGEQLGYLDRNVVSIQKARDAYR